jgi:hypothetical protein
MLFLSGLGGQQLDSDFWITVLSIAASISQVYRILFYLTDIKRTYRFDYLQTVGKLMALGSKRDPPFLLVLRSWKEVDYATDREYGFGDAPTDTRQMSMVAEDLVDNDTLQSVVLAKHQLCSKQRVGVIAPALRSNRSLQRICVVDLDVEEEEKDRISKKEDSKPTKGNFLPGSCIAQLLLALNLRHVHLEGFECNPKHMMPMAAALANLRCLETLALWFKGGPGAAGPVRLAGEDAKGVKECARVLSRMRSLRSLSLRRLPPGVLKHLLTQALTKSRSITAVDLSFNALEPAVIATLAAWVKRAILRELVCGGVVVVSQDTGQVDKTRMQIAAVDTLVKVASWLEVFVLTLDHPLQIKDQEEKEPLSKVGAVSERDLQKLANVCRAAAVSTRVGCLFAAGLHPHGTKQAQAGGGASYSQRRWLSDKWRRMKR